MPKDPRVHKDPQAPQPPAGGWPPRPEQDPGELAHIRRLAPARRLRSEPPLTDEQLDAERAAYRFRRAQASAAHERRLGGWL